MKKIIVLVLTVMIVLSLVACNSSPQPTASEETTPAASLAPEAAAPSDDGKPIKIGYACMDMTSTFHATVAKYFQRECDQRGIELLFLDDKRDPKTAVENCQLIVDSGCVAYIGSTANLVGDAVIEICNEAGVLAIGLDEALPNSPFCGTNNVLAGNLLGEAMVEQARTKWGADVEIDLYIALEFLAAGPNTARMIDGVLAGLRSKIDIPDSIYIQCDSGVNPQDAMRWTEDTLTAHPEAQHILISGFVDDNGQGAQAAVEKLGLLDKVVIGTCDGNILAINNFKDPNTAWTVATALLPEMYAYTLLEKLEPYLRGETNSLPDEWFVNPVAITKDNYEQLLKESVIYDDYVPGA